MAGSLSNHPGTRLRFAQVHTAGFSDDGGFCQDCDVPFCHQHWHVFDTGSGYCPRAAMARAGTRISLRYSALRAGWWLVRF